MTPIRALPGHQWMLPLCVHDDHSPELSGLLSLQRTIRNYAERQWEGPADPDGCMADSFGTQARKAPASAWRRPGKDDDPSWQG